MELALAIDPDEAKAYVATLSQRYPSKTRRELVEHMIRRARWWGAGFGFATGVSSNPWVAAPAAITDISAVLRTEILLACRIGVLFDPHLLDGPDPPYELLVPIIGGRAASEALGRLVASSGIGLTRKTIITVLKQSGVKPFKQAMLKYFGVRVTQRGVISKTIPIVGGLIGGFWNYAELRLVGDRIRNYFEGHELTVDINVAKTPSKQTTSLAK
jgi:hypothetical protein